MLFRSAEIDTLLIKLILMRYKGKGNIREYITEMSHLASKLKTLKLDLSEDLLVHLVLISLPTQFSQFKVSYNYEKETWSLKELISHCIQEEKRLKQDKIEYTHLASTTKNKDKGTKRIKDKEAANTAPQKKQQKKPKDQERTSYSFSRAERYKRKHCTKKGMLHNLVCSEINSSSVPGHTWWIDSGATTHISVSMQGCLSC